MFKRKPVEEEPPHSPEIVSPPKTPEKSEEEVVFSPEDDKKYRVKRWLVVFASFICNGLIFGVINSVSVIFNELKKILERDGVGNAATKGSLVMSLSIGMTFFLSPVAGILTDKIGLRKTTFLGGSLAIFGLIVSAVFPHNVNVLYFSFGVILGVGASLAYTPSLVILGHYFTRRLGLANGLATTGSSVFTIGYPYLLEALIVNFGLRGCFIGLASFMSLILGCAFVFKPILPKVKKEKMEHQKCLGKMKGIINVDNWKIPKYVVWAFALPASLFGYFVSFVHLVAFVNEEFDNQYDGKILIQCIAGTSFIGRLLSGKAADMRWVNVITLQQVSVYFLGGFTILIPLVHNYYALIVITLCMGLFDGTFVTLIGTVAFKICGKDGASQAIGFVLGLCAIPITLGPPLAGFLYDQTKAYQYSFLTAGGLFLTGASIFFFMLCFKDRKPVDDVDEVNVPLNEGPQRKEIIRRMS